MLTPFRKFGDFSDFSRVGLSKLTMPIISLYNFMPERDDGLRSLRCCKRRSVVSNLRGFGHNWSSSRLRIAIIHPSPIRSNPYSTFSQTPSGSDIALAAVAGLTLQGHSVTLYTSGYREKDIPDYLWTTSGEVKSCIPRILRLAMYGRRGVAQSSLANGLVSIIICVRVILGCLVTYLVNLAWSMLPLVVQRARGQLRPPSVLDVVVTFGDNILPQIILSPLAKEVVHFPLNKDFSEIVPSHYFMDRIFNLSRASLILATTDYECVKWGAIAPTQKVLTIYPPVVSLSVSPLTPRNGPSRSQSLAIISSPDVKEIEAKVHELSVGSARPYFVALAWYPVFQDVLLAIEAFSSFINSHSPPPGEASEPEDEGCTGSGKILNLPRLVIAGVEMDNYLLVLREINRLKLIEGEDVVVLSSSIPPATMSDLLERSVGIIHTPGEINHIRIPCAGMLACKPVITTVAFSHSEPVRHEATGVLVKSRSPQLVGQAIDHIYNLFVTRHQEWNRMGHRGKQRAVTEFSIEMFGSRLDDILEVVKTTGTSSAAVATTAPQRQAFGSSPSLRPLTVVRRISSASFSQNLHELGAASD